MLALLSVALSLITRLPTWILAPVSIAIIMANEVIEVKRSHKQKLNEIALRIKDRAQDFQQRFLSSGSALSIFYLINELGNTKSERQEILRAWADGCRLGQRFLEHWLHYFIENLALVVQRRKKYEQQLPEQCEEFWRMNRSYFEFVKEFYRRAESENIPKYLEDYYNGFVAEYNEFVRVFRDTVTEAKQLLRLGIVPQSIDFAKELHKARYG